MTTALRTLGGALCAILVTASAAWSQPANGTPMPETLKVFLDCGDGCDFDFLRQKIGYIHYVRDRKDADVHVLVTTRNTGTGGREYSL